MAQFKEILIAHVEKIVFGLVLLYALVCLGLSVFGGPGDEVDENAIRRRITEIKNHLDNTKVTGEKSMDLSPAKILAGITGKKTATLWASSGWDGFYSAPPRPRVQNIAGSEMEIVLPDAAQPTIMAPANMTVRLYKGHVIVYFSEDPSMRGLADVKATLWRKAVGKGDDDIDMAYKNQEQLMRKGQESGSQVTRAPQSTAFGGFSAGMEPGMMPPDMMPAPGAMGMNPNAGQGVGVEGLGEIEAEKQLLAVQEKVADGDLEELIDGNKKITTTWEVAAEGLDPVNEAPTPIYFEYLVTGTRPDPATFGFAGMEGAGYGNNMGMAPTMQPTEAMNPTGAGGNQLRWFYYVEKTENIDEGFIYRYRAMFSGKPDMNFIRSGGMSSQGGKVELTEDFKPYVKIGSTRLAPLKDEAEELLAGIDKPSEGAEAVQPGFEKLVPIIGIQGTQTVETLGIKPSRSAAYKQMRKRRSDEDSFGPLSYSDYIIMPTKQKIVLKFGSVDKVSLEVTILDDNGIGKPSSFMLEDPKGFEPEIQPGIDPKKPLSELYPWDKIKDMVVVIGEEKTVYDKVERKSIPFDFRTNWGLVDIRPCKVTSQRFKKSLMRDRRTRAPLMNPDGTPKIEVKPLGGPMTSNDVYIVVVELEPREGKERRYERILKNRRPVKNQFEEIEVDWYPAEEKTEEAKPEDAAPAEAPAE